MKILGLEGREERVESRWLGIATSFVTLGWLPPPQGEEGGKHTKRERERERARNEGKCTSPVFTERVGRPWSFRKGSLAWAKRDARPMQRLRGRSYTKAGGRDRGREGAS